MPRWSRGSGHRFFIGVSLTTAPPHFGTKKPKALKFTEHREVAGSNPVRGTTSFAPLGRNALPTHRTRRFEERYSNQTM